VTGFVKNLGPSYDPFHRPQDRHCEDNATASPFSSARTGLNSRKKLDKKIIAQVYSITEKLPLSSRLDASSGPDAKPTEETTAAIVESCPLLSISAVIANK